MQVDTVWKGAGLFACLCLLVLFYQTPAQPLPANGSHREHETMEKRTRVGAIHMLEDDDFFRRSQTTLDGLNTVTRALHHAQRKGELRIAILGGSVSAGGGCRSCKPKIIPECGLCWHSVLSEQMRRRGLNVRIVNGARGSTGPDFAYLCADMLLQEKRTSKRAEIFDLVILEFGINAGRGPDCTQIGKNMEALLTRARSIAHAVIFLNTFSRNIYMDAALCFDILARYHSVPSVSWKDALWPLIRNGHVQPADVFQLPLLHHPNVQGHRQLGMIIARLLERANQTWMSTAEPMRLSVPPLYGQRGAPQHAHARFATCIDAEHLKPSANLGWSLKGTGTTWWYASSVNANLTLPILCEQAGCGLVLLLTRSYQPLGMLDIFVDGKLRYQKVSAADKIWALKQDPKHTIQRLLRVIEPGTSTGLRMGAHALTVICRGETDPDLATVHLLGNAYMPNEVHVRGLIVMYE